MKKQRWTKFPIKISLVLLLATTYLPIVRALDAGIAFKGFNQENFSDLQTNFSQFQQAVITADEIRLIGTSEGIALSYFDLGDIGTSVDLGNLMLAFSIQTLSSEDDDQLSVSIIFSSDDQMEGTGQVQHILTRDVNKKDQSITLSGNYSIPTGTRYVFFSITSKNSTGQNTAVFTNPSFKIMDQDIPLIESNRSDQWQTSHQEITITASDGQSGIEGIYDGVTDQKISSQHQYTYISSVDTVRHFYTKDYAGNISKTMVVDPSLVDDQSPADAPMILLSHTDWVSQEVSFTLSFNASAQGSQETLQYRLNQGEWINYTGEQTIQDEGVTLISARVIDQAKNVSPEAQAQVKIDKTKPVISNVNVVSLTQGSRITFETSDALSSIEMMKWMSGEQTVETVLQQGTLIEEMQFDVTQAGTYTLVVVDGAGNASLYITQANTKPTISEISPLEIEQDTEREIEISVHDYETAFEDLIIEISSDNQALLPAPSFRKETGKIYLSIDPVDGAYGGPVTITVRVTDLDGNTSTRTFIVVVERVNDAPIAMDDLYELNENSQLDLYPLENDADANKDTLTIIFVSQPLHGTIVISDDLKSLKYTPNQYYNGEDSVIYRVSDGVDSDTATIRFKINDINQAPEAKGDQYTIDEDTKSYFDVLNNDIDHDLGITLGEKLTITQVSGLVYGSASIEDGKIVYTPKKDWSGTETFSYTIEDHYRITSTATIKVVVKPVNDLPEFVDLISQIEMDEDSEAYTFRFSISDVETIADSLMLQVFSTNETLIKSSNIQVLGVGDASGEITIRFTSEANKFGLGGLRLRLSDGLEITSISLPVSVRAVNDSPLGGEDDINFTEDTPVYFSVQDLLKNDTDIDSEILIFDGILKHPLYGTLTQGNEGYYCYVPNENSDKDDSFSYYVSDGLLRTEVKVHLIARPVNDTPTIVYEPDSQTIYQEDEVASNIYFDISDVETPSDKLIVTFSSSQTNLVASNGIRYQISGNRVQLIVTPVANQYGTSTLFMTVSDGQKYTTSSVEVEFQSVNDAPLAIDDQIYLVRNASVSFNPLANDYDIEKDAISIISYDEPSIGTLSRAGDIFTYTPPTNYYGKVTIKYIISDGLLESEGTINLNVSKYEVPPEISGIANLAIYEDNSTPTLSYTIKNRFGELDFSSWITSTNENLVKDDSINVVPIGNGQFEARITPVADANGEVTLIIHARDDDGIESVKTFILTIYPVDDQPTANDDRVSVNEDESVMIDVLANDSDIDTDRSNFKLIHASSPLHGTLEQNNGQYKYTPKENYNGPDEFEYTMTDGTHQVSAVVSITVIAVNDAPQVHTQYKVLPNVVEASLDINTLSGAWDVDGDTLYLDSIEVQPQYGTLTQQGSQVTYTRNQVSPLGRGRDQFTVILRDREDANDPDVLYVYGVIIIATEFDRSFVGDAYGETYEDTAVWVGLNISDDVIISKIEFDVSVLGAVTEIDIENHRVKIVPFKDMSGRTEMIYHVSEQGTEVTQYASLHLTVLPVNDAPEFTNELSDVDLLEDHVSEWILVDYEDVDSAELAFTFQVENQNISQPILNYNNVEVKQEDEKTYIRFRPIPQASGSATVVLTVSDGVASATSSLTINVEPVNDAPVATDMTIKLAEDTRVTFTLFDVNSDVEKDPLTVMIKSFPIYGTLSVNPEDQSVTYIPFGDYHGEDSFEYVLSDGMSESLPAKVSLVVENTPDAPTITGLESLYTFDEDGSLVILFSVDDADGEDVNARINNVNSDLFDVEGLVLTKTGDKTYSLTVKPKQDAYGEAKIEVLFGNNNDLYKREITLIVRSINDEVISEDDDYTINEDQVTLLDVLDNDHDVEDKVLQIVAITNPMEGATLVLNGNGTLTYTPKLNYFGPDEFTYTVSDSNNSMKTSTVRLDIRSVNDAPITVEDVRVIQEDEVILFNVLDNDSDVENDPLVIVGFNGAKYAQEIKDLGNGLIMYTPRNNVFGVEEFTYTVSDGTNTSIGQVRIYINAVNDAPLLVKNEQNSGVWSFDEDTVGSFLFDVSDAETVSSNLILTVTSLDQSIIPNENIKLSGKDDLRTIRFTPLANQNGTVKIKFTISDGEETTEVIYDVVVNSVNDAPVLGDASFSVDEDGVYNGRLSATDVDSSTLTYSLQTQAGKGTVVVNADGSYQYKPLANYNGTDSFVVSVDDQSGATNGVVNATVSVMVRPVNDSPKANDDQVSGEEDVLIDIYPLLNDTDIDLDVDLNKGNVIENLTIKSVSANSNVTSVISTDKKSIKVTPKANYNGVVVLTYVIQDTAGVTSNAKITITFVSVNDKPANGDDVYTIQEDSNSLYDVLVNDDVDMKDVSSTEILTILEIISAPQHGSATIEDNKIRYRPDENFYGDDELKYRMKDDEGQIGEFLVKFKVQSVNDLPTITSVSDIDINEDTETDPIVVSVGDVETDLKDLVLTFKSSNENIVKASSIQSEVSEGFRTFIIRPVKDANGSVTITLRVTDADQGYMESQFKLNIKAINDAPEAVTFNRVVDEDLTLTFELLTKLVDVDVNPDLNQNIEDELTGSIKINGAHGTARFEGTTFVYEPHADFFGEDQVTYTVTDKSLQSVDGIVNITVNPVNDAPIITIIPSTTIYEDESLENFEIELSDIEGLNDENKLILTAKSLDPNKVSNNSIVLKEITQNKRTLSLTPVANENGYVDIELSVVDENGAGLKTTTTLRVNITPVNDAPINGDDEYIFNEDMTQIFDVLKNDDIDLKYEGDVLTLLEIVKQPEHGNATINATTQKIEYSPSKDYYGTDEFSYKMKDKGEAVNVFNVKLTINPVNDAPVISVIADVAMDESETRYVDFTVSDVDSVLTLVSLSAASSRAILFTTNLTDKISHLSGDTYRLTLTPNGKWNGDSNITVSVIDSGGLKAEQKFKVSVRETNDRPVAEHDFSEIAEDGNVRLDLLANDTDIDLTTNADKEKLRVTSLTPTAAVAGVWRLEEERYLVYTPTANYNGQVVFDYVVSDSGQVGTGGVLTSSAQATITIRAVNDAPIALLDSAEVDEDGSVTIEVLKNDRDVDQDSTLNQASGYDLSAQLIRIQSVGSASHGSVSHENGIVTYTPVADYNGSDTFEYIIEDQDGDASRATVNITIHSVNDRPVAEHDFSEIAEDGNVRLDLLANDTDIDLTTNADKEKLRVTSLTPTAAVAGVWRLEEERYLVYTPTANYNGQVVFDYVVSDSGQVGTGGVLTSSAQATITIRAVNDAPIALLDSAEVDEDGSVTIEVLKNDRDVDQDSALNQASGYDLSAQLIRIQSVGSASHGSVSHENGIVTYTPVADYNGSDTFEYIIEDQDGDASRATVNITIHSVNDRPVAVNDTVSIQRDESISVDVMENDRDIDQSRELNQAPDYPFEAQVFEIVLVGVVNTEHGKVELVNNEILYKPNKSFSGIDTYQYTIRDQYGAESSALLTINVGFVNHEPVAYNDVAETNEDHAIEIDVLNNDIDIDMDPSNNTSGELDTLTIVSALATTGKVTIVNGKLWYIPLKDYNGSDHIAYTIVDSHGGQADATVHVEIIPVNDHPEAVADASDIYEDQELIYDVVANDKDIDRDPLLNLSDGYLFEKQTLALQSIKQPAHGTAYMNENKIVYKANADYNGTDQLEYTIVDQDGKTSTSTLTIEVIPVNDKPVAVVDHAIVSEDSAVMIDVLENDFDVDQYLWLNQSTGYDFNIQSLFITAVGEPAHGSVVVKHQKIQYIPNADYNGVDSFTYTIEDQDGVSAETTVNVVIIPVNDAPKAQDVHNIINEDEINIQTVVDASIDVDLNVLLNAIVDEEVTITILDGPSHGQVEIKNNQIIYSPMKDYNGVDEITYQLKDKAESIDVGRLTYVILPVEDRPVAVADEVIMDEDQSILIDVLLNDIDVDQSLLLNQTVNYDFSVQKLSITALTQPAHGVVSIMDQKLYYTPVENYNGSDSFSYVINDQSGLSSYASVEVEVRPVNDDPVAVNDQIVVNEDQETSINVLENDRDIDQDKQLNRSLNYDFSLQYLRIVSITQPLHGQVTLKNNAVQYIPALDFNGLDQFTYEATDLEGKRTTATVNIEVLSVNDAPTQPRVIAPTKGFATRRSMNVLVQWEASVDVDGDLVNYDVYFFDGIQWILLAENLYETEYLHMMQSFETSDKAQYRVVAKDNVSQSASVSELVVIDNQAPQDTKIEWICVNQTAPCTQYRGFKITAAQDLLKVRYYYRFNDLDPWEEIAVDVLVELKDHDTVWIKMVDAVGNESVINGKVEAAETPAVKPAETPHRPDDSESPESPVIPEKPTQPTTPETPVKPTEPSHSVSVDYTVLVKGVSISLVVLGLILWLGLIKITYINEQGKKKRKYKFIRWVGKGGTLALADQYKNFEQVHQIEVRMNRVYTRFMRSKMVSLNVNHQSLFVSEVAKKQRGAWTKRVMK